MQVRSFFLGIVASFVVAVIAVLVSGQFKGSTRAIISLLGLEFDPDVDRNVTELISSRGYPVEDHIVQTEDGYLLSVQRIPHGRSGTGTGAKKEAVLLVHGLQLGSDCFLLHEPEGSLGFLLADAGYDVWLANLRGNRYSKSHIKFANSDAKFWDFGFDEMAKYDLPAIIQHVLAASSQKQLYYIGMSMGTFTSFALLSSKPEFNQKIKLNIAMAPATHFANVKGVPGWLTVNGGRLAELVQPFELCGGETTQLVTRLVCNTMLRPICLEIFALLGRSEMTNESRSGVYFAHFPAGSSMKTVMHSGQLIQSKRFSMYDYGVKRNVLEYGQDAPPEYDLSHVTAPTALFWSATDQLTTSKDVATLRSRLPNVVLNYEVPSTGVFTHVDFVFGSNAADLVYSKVLELIVSFSSVNTKTSANVQDQVKENRKL